MNAGLERLRQNQLSDAIARFREAIGLDPKNAQAHYQLGLALRRRGDVAEAKAEFASARRLAPYLRAARQPVIG